MAPKIKVQGKLGEIWAKILRTPKNLPAPTPMVVYTFMQSYVALRTQGFISFVIPHLNFVFVVFGTMLYFV